MGCRYIIDEWDLNEFNPDDVIDDISDDTLRTEYERRFAKKVVENSLEKPLYVQLQECGKMKLHDFLADLTNLQHTCSKEQILDELSHMI